VISISFKRAVRREKGKEEKKEENSLHRRKENKKDGTLHTKPTALNTFTSNAFLHSSTLLSPTFFTGSKEPWLIIRLSRRPHRDFATSTAFAARDGSLMSPASTETCSAPYWAWSLSRAARVRETRMSLWEWVRRWWAIAKPMPSERC